MNATEDNPGTPQHQALLQATVSYYADDPRTLAVAVFGTTSPNIVDSIRVLAGRIDGVAIKAAGLANECVGDGPLGRVLDMCVRYAVGVDVALQRRQIWGAIELLHRMRGLLMELFTRARNGVRAYHVFQAEADAVLQARLGATLPQYDLISVRESLARFLEILEHDLGQLAGGQVQLTEAHRRVLNLVRTRQEHLNGGNTRRSLSTRGEA